MVMARLAAIVVCVVMLGVSESMAVHDLFKSIDSDTDGRVSEKEFSEDMNENAFDRIDVDKNKMISMQEWEPLAEVTNKKKHMELFESIDRDRDRRISFLEFSDYAERHSNIEEAFIGLDKDRNNSLSPDEITVRPLFKMITIRF